MERRKTPSDKWTCADGTRGEHRSGMRIRSGSARDTLDEREKRRVLSASADANFLAVLHLPLHHLVFRFSRRRVSRPLSDLARARELNGIASTRGSQGRQVHRRVCSKVDGRQGRAHQPSLEPGHLGPRCPIAPQPSPSQAREEAKRRAPCKPSKSSSILTLKSVIPST
jgi:hypothetical protein